MLVANVKHLKTLKIEYVNEQLKLQGISLSEDEKKYILNSNYGVRNSYNKLVKPTEQNIHSDEELLSYRNAQYVEDLQSFLDHYYSLEFRNEEHYLQFIYGSKGINIILKIDPFYQNTRRISQSGCFLSQNNSDISFKEIMDVLNSYDSKIITKINIPATLRAEILQDLKKMNIIESSMFPDLDGFIRSLAIVAEN